jgi:hypothetical protein
MTAEPIVDILVAFAYPQYVSDSASQLQDLLLMEHLPAFSW